MTDTMNQANGQAGDAAGQQKSGYNADAPIGSVGNLRQMLEQYTDRIAEVMPEHLTPERMLKMTLIAFNKTPKLLECTQGSIMQTVLEASELGVNISGTAGEAYPVPFYNNREKRMECQLIVGYKGLIKLARQSGEVIRVEAEVVYDNDSFTFKKGSEVLVEWRPYLKADRGEALGAYALVELSDGSIQAEWMPASEIEKVKNVSKAKNYGPWSSEFEHEMWRKTAWRRLSKWSPLSSERYNRALEISDKEFDWDVVDRKNDGAKAQALAERLLEAKSEPDIKPEDFAHARQQAEQRETVPAQERRRPQHDSEKLYDTRPEQQSEPEPDPEQNDQADELAELIGKMQIEVETCAEHPTREVAVSAMRSIYKRYLEQADSWSKEDKERLANAYLGSADVVDKAFKSEEPAGTAEDPPPAAKNETAEPPQQEPAGSEFGNEQLFT